MRYPPNFDYLGTVGTLPKMVTVAFGLFGIHEGPGSVDNPTIMEWAEETGLDAEGYTADAIPWCGLFMALVATRAGYDPPKHPLWALNWQGFGTEGHQPCLGDVLAFVRPAGGHVGLYLGEDNGAYAVVGGNTGDQVAVAWIEKTRLRAVREPLYKIGRPASSRPYLIDRHGQPLSRNEK